ncbi:uncharacterized protein LOC120342577 [Styela clava]
MQNYQQTKLSCFAVTECKTRWRSTKDRFRKEKRKEIEATRSGAAARGYRAWKFMEILKLLDEHVDFRTTSSDVDEDVTLVVLEDADNMQINGEAEDLSRADTSWMTSASESVDAKKFAISLVDTLCRLPVQRFQLAKVRIHELLYNIEFGEI